ncbi:MAG: hypothetical protein ACI39U_01170, partial [Candidatus Cryptobacteroides sp.]
MKKQLFQNLGCIIGKAVIVASLACPIVLSSCSKLAFDDTELKESIKDLNDRLTALEEKVSSEIATLTQIVNGKVTVVTVVTNNDGSKTVTLSNGDTF